MRPLPWIICLLALVAGVFGQPALAASAGNGLPPKPARYVEDQAGLLSAPTREALVQKLAAYERETSNQVLVAIFPTLPTDYAMEDFTQRTAEAWGVGQKATDNGAVLFVFVRDHKLRLEVGYGLEGAIPDATAKAIIDHEITPAFRAGDFNGGVTRGVDAILQAARGEYKGTGRTNADRTPEDDGALFGPSMFFLVLVFFFFWWAGRRRGTTYGRRGVRRSGGWFPVDFGGGGSSGRFGGGSSGGGFSGGGGGFGGGGASGGW
jgi:uncharacterized protein